MPESLKLSKLPAFFSWARFKYVKINYTNIGSNVNVKDRNFFGFLLILVGI